MKASIHRGFLTYRCEDCNTEHKVKIGGVAPASYVLVKDGCRPGEEAYWWNGSLENPTVMPVVYVNACRHRILDGYLYYQGEGARVVPMADVYTAPAESLRAPAPRDLQVEAPVKRTRKPAVRTHRIPKVKYEQTTLLEGI